MPALRTPADIPVRDTTLDTVLDRHARWLRTQGTSDVDGERADLSGCDLAGCVLTGCDLSGAALSGASIVACDLPGGSFVGCDLSGAYLMSSDLTGCDFTGATLSDCTFSGSDLSRASLTCCDLAGCDLSGVTLTGTNLAGCDLTGCDLAGSALAGTVLMGARGILALGPVGSIGRILYVVSHEDGPRAYAGCWRGTVPELRARARRVHAGSPHAAAYDAICDYVEAHARAYGWPLS